MGRRPLPAEILQAQGTWRADRHAKPRTGKPGPEAVLPRHLEGDAREFWIRHAPRLRERGLLDVDSAAAFERLCQVWGEVRGYDEYIREVGKVYDTGGMIRPRPEISMRAEADKRLRQYLIEFGLTPAARTKVRGEATEEDDTADPVAAYLNS